MVISSTLRDCQFIHELLEPVIDNCTAGWWSAHIIHPYLHVYISGVAQLNHLSLLTRRLSPAQYTISLRSWPEQSTTADCRLLLVD